MINTDDINVWRTHSNMRVLWASAPSASAALTQLASAIKDFGIDQYVIGLEFVIDEDGSTIIVGALTEESL